MGETRSAANLLLQAKLCMDTKTHMAVVRRMYEIRFPEVPTQGLTLQQIRGLEGVRVRQAYQSEAKRCGLQWTARKYKQTSWDDSDEINRSLSTANAILYSVCQAAIVSLGYSTGLGFIHTGKLLSFIYDIADLYKTETSIPAAFEAVQAGLQDLNKRVRTLIRKRINDSGIMKRIPNDIAKVFDIPSNHEQTLVPEVGKLWDLDGDLDGGKNYAEGGDI